MANVVSALRRQVQTMWHEASMRLLALSVRADVWRREREERSRGVSRSAGKAPWRPGGRPLLSYSNPALDDAPDWRDVDGRSPVDLLIEYMRRRRQWDFDRAKVSFRNLRPDHPDEERTRADLEKLHTDLSTPSPLSERDTSASSAPDRDPAKGQVMEIRRLGADSVVITSEEEVQDGHLRELFETTLVRLDGRWRLDERALITSPRGERISGLL